jgi:17beta-estradiol 17-dehydrogenase / very-long-chain 3-oxoacyl-CoA reductase
MYKHFGMKMKNLKERYGSKSWVLVTGATDGIGKGIAFKFGSLGFNIILISRSQDKLNTVVDELRTATNGEIEVKTLAFDFSLKTTVRDYEEAFLPLTSLDISVLVNNVGWVAHNKSDSFEGKALQDSINVNLVPQAMLTAIFSRQLSTRKGLRSAIINLSSFASMIQGEKLIHSACKTFNNLHSKTIHYELSESIDSISVKPMLVRTALTESSLSKAKESNVVTVDTLVESVFKQIG